MSNHVHLVLLPGREDSLSLLLRRVHGRYAQYYNARWGRVERNPVRAGIVDRAVNYV
jgi:REP element-mobilizing transposase RayT